MGAHSSLYFNLWVRWVIFGIVSGPLLDLEFSLRRYGFTNHHDGRPAVFEPDALAPG